MYIMISVIVICAFFALLGLAERFVPGQILDKLCETIFGGKVDE